MTTRSQQWTKIYWPEGPALQAQFINALREILDLDPMPGRLENVPPPRERQENGKRS